MRASSSASSVGAVVLLGGAGHPERRAESFGDRDRHRDVLARDGPGRLQREQAVDADRVARAAAPSPRRSGRSGCREHARRCRVPRSCVWVSALMHTWVHASSVGIGSFQSRSDRAATARRDDAAPPRRPRSASATARPARGFIGSEQMFSAMTTSASPKVARSSSGDGGSTSAGASKASPGWMTSAIAVARHREDRRSRASADAPIHFAASTDTPSA